MQKKYQVGIVALLFVSILAAGVFAFGQGSFKHDAANPAVQQAIAADDYVGFTQALAAQNHSSNITQAKFEKLASHAKTGAATRNAMQKAQDAIKNNDYNAWQSAMSPIAKDSTHLTQQTFDSLVQRYQAQQKVQQAISNKDFASWKQAMNDQFQLELTQDHFDAIVKRSANETNPPMFGNGRAHMSSMMQMRHKR